MSGHSNRLRGDVHFTNEDGEVVVWHDAEIEIHWDREGQDLPQIYTTKKTEKFTTTFRSEIHQ